MADEKIVIQIQDQIAPSIIKKLKEIAEYSNTGQKALDNLKKGLAGASTASLKTAIQQERLKKAVSDSLRAQNNAALSASRLQREHAKLSDSTNKVTISTNRAKMSVYQLDKAQSQAALSALRLQNAQARKAKQAAAEAAPKGGGSVSSLVGIAKGAVGAYLGFQSAKEILGLSSAYTDLQNKLKMVTTSNAELATVTQRVFEIANKTRVPVEDTAKAFVRFDLALQQLGASQGESLRLTETVNKMLIISGASAGEAGSSLLQLSQAFNKGKLDGDEFRSVMELMPPVADAIAKELGVTRGELLKLAPEGKITAQVMREALASVSDEIDEKFGKTIPTVGQSLIQLKNTAIQVFGEMSKQSKLTEGLSLVLKDLAGWLEENRLGFVNLSNSITTFFNKTNDSTKTSLLGQFFTTLLGGINRVTQGVGVLIRAIGDAATLGKFNLVGDYLDRLTTAEYGAIAEDTKLNKIKAINEQVSILEKTLTKIEMKGGSENLKIATMQNLTKYKTMLASLNGEELGMGPVAPEKNVISSAMDHAGKKIDEVKVKYASLTDMMNFTSHNAPEYLPPRGAESFIGNMNAGVTLPGAEPSMFTDLGVFGFSSEVIEASKVQFTTLEEQYKHYYDQIGIMRAMNVIDDKKAEEMKAKFAREKAQERLGYTSEVLGNLSTLMQSSSKDAFRVGKAAAMAQAGIDASGAILKALNSPPGGIGSTIIAASIGAAAAVQMANIAQQQPPGFKEGGFTGYEGTSQVAGVVHGQEFVTNAAATARYRPMLERINKGGSAVSVTIENYGTSKDFEVEQVTPDQIRIIARDEVRSQVPSLMASESMNPNSKFSKAMQNSTNLQRKRV